MNLNKKIHQTKSKKATRSKLIEKSNKLSTPAIKLSIPSNPKNLMNSAFKISLKINQKKITKPSLLSFFKFPPLMKICSRFNKMN
jgi:hypothetical protein